MKSEKICFFIGHREASEMLFENLVKAVEYHVTEYGVTEFVVGKYGKFDSLAAKAVREIKKKYPEIVLTLLLPYHPAEHPIEMPKGFDGTLYPEGMERVPKRAAIVRANRYMVERSGYLICFVWHTGSNAGEILKYAEEREKKGKIRILNLSEKE